MSRQDMVSHRPAAGSARRGLFALAAAVALALAPAMASAQGVSIVRDAETEALLQDYLAPLFKAANVRAGQMQVFIVPSDEFNAFVTDNSHMFVNVGAILESN